ncbi:MAG: hypothetical protein ACRCY4_02705 [Brevinema sp.]
MRVLFFLIFAVSSALYSQSSPIQVRISLFKQTFSSDEPLKAYVSFYNQSIEEQQFDLSDVLFQSLVFDLRSSANETIPLRPEMDALARTTYSNPSLYRRMRLAPGESFTFTSDLRTYFDVPKSGSYYVRARFYPDPDNRSDEYFSEYFSFAQTPPAPVMQRINQEQTRRAAALEEARQFLPGEVIQDLFEAQLKKDWERFLVHIDAEQLINAFDQYARQYNASIDGTFRLDLLEQFKRFLTSHWNIHLAGYEIRETIIRRDTATVEADAFERIRTQTRRIRYSFELSRNGQGQWRIDNYVVLAVN